jgi:hypothetical protein
MPCADPVDLPPGPLNSGPAERAWIVDRINLGDCRDRFAGYLAWSRHFRAALGGK